MARSARCLGPPSVSERPPSTTSSGPRIRNSTVVSGGDGNTSPAPSADAQRCLSARLHRPSDAGCCARTGFDRAPGVYLPQEALTRTDMRESEREPGTTLLPTGTTTFLFTDIEGSTEL